MAESFDADALQQKLLNPDTEEGQRNFGTFESSIESSIESSVLDVPGAFLRRENIFGSSFLGGKLQLERMRAENEPEFDYFDKVPDDLMMFRDRFVAAKSQQEINLIANAIRREQKDENILSQHPFATFAIGIPMSLLDPTALLPGGQIYKSYTQSYNFARSFASSATAGAIAQAGQELVLGSSQQTRTVEESFANVVGTAMIGGLLGGSAGVWASSKMAANGKKESGNAAMGKQETPKTYQDAEQNLNAAKYDDSLLREKQNFYGPADVLAKQTRNFNPILRLGTNPLLSARKAAETLFDYQIPTDSNLPDVGIPRNQAFETFVKSQLGKYRKNLLDYQDIYFKQRGIEKGPLKKFRQAFQNEGMPFEQFDVEVGKAIREKGVHPNESVAEAANLLLDKVYYPIRDAAIQLGLLSPNVDVVTASEYFMRVYNRSKVDQQSNEFFRISKNYIQSKNEQRKQIDPLVKKHNQEVASLKRQITKLKKRVEAIKSGEANETVKAQRKTLRSVMPAGLKTIRMQDVSFIASPKFLKMRNDYLKAKKEGQIKRIKKIFNELPESLKKKSKNIDQFFRSKTFLQKVNQMKKEIRKLTALEKEMEKTRKGAPQEFIKKKKQLKEKQKAFKDSIPRDLFDSDGNLRGILPDEEAIDAAVQQTIDNIVMRNQDKVINPVLLSYYNAKPKPLNNRTFLIPDKLIEDFTLNSAMNVTDMYIRGMVPAIEAARYGESMGIPGRRAKELKGIKNQIFQLEKTLEQESVNVADRFEAAEKLTRLRAKEAELESPSKPMDIVNELIKDIDREFDERKKGLSNEAFNKLESEMKKAKEDIANGMEVIMGTYGQGYNVIDGQMGKWLRNFKNYQTSTKMGFLGLSSAMDIGNIVMRYGPMQTFGSGIRRVVKGALNIKNKELLQDMGFAVNKAMGNMVHNHIEHQGLGTEADFISRASSDLAQTTVGLSGHNYVQDFLQEVAGDLSISNTLRAAHDLGVKGKMKPRDAKRLNALGISEGDARVLYKLWKETGGISDGAFYANYGDWDLTNPDAARAYMAFRNSIYTDIRTTIIEPGAGDLPFTARDPKISVLLQFKNFLMAAHNNILASGLAQNDAEFYFGMVTLLSMGALHYVVTSTLRGKEVDLSPGNLAVEAVDRSGSLGILFELFNVGSKFINMGGVSRYRSRGVVGAWMGPTAGSVEDIWQILTRVLDSTKGDTTLTTRDVEKLMRLVPYNNLFYLHYLDRQVAKSLAVNLGARENT